MIWAFVQIGGFTRGGKASAVTPERTAGLMRSEEACCEPPSRTAFASFEEAREFEEGFPVSKMAFFPIFSARSARFLDDRVISDETREKDRVRSGGRPLC